MKILLIHNRYKKFGGEDSVFEREKNLLKSKGNDVETLIFYNSDIKTFYDKLKTGLFSLYNLESALKLKKIVNTFKPDLIHVHNFFPIASPSIFYTARRKEIPIVLTLHNYRLLCPNGLFLKGNKVCTICLKKRIPYPSLFFKCYRDSFIETFPVFFMLSAHNILGTWSKTVNAFVFLTEFQREIFLNSHLNFPYEKIFVKPNFSEDFGEGGEKREDFFLYVGRLSEEKGIRVLIDAQRKGGFKLFVAGDGPLRNFILNYERKAKNFKYIGFLKKQDIINYMKRTKALIFPSIWYENFPLSIVEAFSSGTPVIASSIGALKELIDDGSKGLLFKTGNSDDLLDKIKKFERIKGNLLYKNSRKVYLEKYTPSVNYELLMNIYKTVLKKGF